MVQRQSFSLARSGFIRRGFTMIEILVVVAIIGVLIAILIPSIGHIKANAIKATAQAQLGSIQSGLQAYFQEFAAYPPSRSGLGAPIYGNLPAGRGPAMLAQGLMGYMPYGIDGAGSNQGGASYAVPPAGEPAFGFRTRQSVMGGKIYGPYVNNDPKQYKQNSTSVTFDEAFIDPWGHEILYYRATGNNAQVTTRIFGIINDPANPSFFIYDDCSKRSDGSNINSTNSDPSALPATTATANFFKSFSSNTSNTYSGGIVTGSDSYLLISAGPDGIYFNADDLVAGKQ